MSADLATLGIWTIARFAAVAVLITETLFIWVRRQNVALPAGNARVFWKLTPAFILAGLCFWCSAHVLERQTAGSPPVVAQLAR